MPDQQVAQELYKRLAGETEARNVQTRMNMSAEQRRASPPWTTQDVLDEDQIVRLLSDNKPSLMGSALASQSSLPMDQASRLARAREMGFDTDTTWYHGTRAGGFDAFDPSLANSSSRTGVPDGAMVFSSSPDNASTYAVTKSGGWGDNLSYEPGAAVIPTYLRDDGLPMVVDAKGASWQDIEYGGKFYDANELAQLAKDLEYEGLLVKNVVDSKVSRGAKPSDTYFEFDPSRIRSTNAAFDPARAGENGLLLSDNKPSLLGSALASGQKRPDPERIKKAIRDRMQGDK
jgi:hypothetical protein